MRLTTLIAGALLASSLAACAPKQDIDPRARVAEPTCLADRLGRFRNQLPSEGVMAEIRGIVGDRAIRVIRPGDAVTMDWAPNRLNIDLGEDGRIARLRCG